MTVLVVTIVDQTFDKKSAEVNYLLRVLHLLENEIGRGRGNVTSGTIVGQNAAGLTNQNLGAWTYVSSASTP